MLIDDNNQDKRDSEHNSEQQTEMSRRQFLNYTLGGTGAFMVGLPLIWNLRFAVDPLLQTKTPTEFVRVVAESEITSEPKRFSFEVHLIEGWYEHDQKAEAWIRRGEDGTIYALSPICQHLGCIVNWNENPDYQNEYYCPCHGAHYTIDGKNLAISPRPLMEYELEIRDGWIYLGGVKSNERVK